MNIGDRVYLKDIHSGAYHGALNRVWIIAGWREDSHYFSVEDEKNKERLSILIKRFYKITKLDDDLPEDLFKI